MPWTEKALDKIDIAGTKRRDLMGEAKPSLLFFPMIRFLAHLLSCEEKKMISPFSLAVRKLLHPLLALMLPLFLEHKQVFESKNALLGIDAPDEHIPLGDEPLIWCPNHRFKDDIAASLRAARHAYILFGSLPAFFNTFDGVGAYINGVVLCNRKVKASREVSTEVAKKVLYAGRDLMVFPEGVWNKFPDKLLLNFWPGAYKLAIDTGSKIVPVIHYLADPHGSSKENVIHTVVAEPISMEGLSEEEGLSLLRDTMATWYYLLMEKYGQSSRRELVGDSHCTTAEWEYYLHQHTGCIRFYDKEIELCADYRPKRIIRPESVWQNVADIQNIHAGNVAHIQYAKDLVRQEQRRDFQRRF